MAIKNDIKARVLIAGGGTGGHIFPALAIASDIKNKNPYVEILFVGSKHRMEMTQIPNAGYRIVGLDIVGLDRKNLLKNIILIFKLLRGFIHSYKIIKKFRPSVVVGVGGYSSFPIVFTAQWLRIPTLLQEQNSYAGLSNRILARRAQIICTGYENMSSFFAPTKILHTGNPVRTNIQQVHTIDSAQAKARFGLAPDKKVILALGGSLGSHAMNHFLEKNLDFFKKHNVQLIWQTGRAQYKRILTKLKHREGVYASDFFANMDEVYAAADIIISRAGALAIAELTIVAKPVIFIPYPYATAQHQYHNARVLAENNAAVLIEEKDIAMRLLPNLESLLKDEEWQTQLHTKIAAYARPKATDTISNAVLKLTGENGDILKKVYMLGIGGSGMRQLAKYLVANNVQVAGYDRERGEHIDVLEKMGILVHHEMDTAHIEKDLDWVIYTAAISEDNTELVYTKKQNIPLLKRSVALGHITRNGYNICVAGTHGKTSVSALTATILRYAHTPANEFIGGEIITRESAQKTAQTQNDSSPTHAKINVIEADEYDRSFLQLSPNIAVITAMDADHLDVYGSVENMCEAYHNFVRKLKPGGILITSSALAQAHNFACENVITFGVQDIRAHVYADNIVIKKEEIHFDVYIHNTLFTSIVLRKRALFDVSNALISIIVAYLLEIPKTYIRDALYAFEGVRQRFEYLYQSEHLVFVHDYAHHPEEVRQAVQSVRRLHEKKRTLAIFQPHLFTRTRDFHKDFAKILSGVDELILLPIYPAREAPISGVTSQLIARHVRGIPVQVLTPKACVEYVRKEKNNIAMLLSIGAGRDLVKVSSEIVAMLDKK